VSSYDDRDALRVDVGATEGLDGAGCAAFDYADVDEEDLIFVVMDEAIDTRTQLDQLAMVQLTLKHGELKVLAPTKHVLVDFAEPLRVGDVVRDDVRVTHGGPQRTRNSG
jgi:hypothetical protein